MYKIPDKNIYIIFDLSAANDLDDFYRPYVFWFKTKREAVDFRTKQLKEFPKSKLSQPKFISFFKDYLFSE